MAFAICGTESVTIKIVFAMARMYFALMFHFSISTHIVKKRGSLGIKCKFFLKSKLSI